MHESGGNQFRCTKEERQGLFPLWDTLQEREKIALEHPRYRWNYGRRTVVDLFKGAEGGENVFLVVRGHLSLMMINPDGQRVCFLRLNRGDWSFVIHSHSLHDIYIEGIAEKGTELWGYRKGADSDLFQPGSPTDAFVRQSQEKMLDGLLELTGDLVFLRLKDRLLKRLRMYADEKAGNEVLVTQETLANDLASSREVISRLLKQLATDGTISCERKRIVLIDKKRGRASDDR